MANEIVLLAKGIVRVLRDNRPLELAGRLNATREEARASNEILNRED